MLRVQNVARKYDQVDGPYMLLLKWYYFSSYIRQIENLIF